MTRCMMMNKLFLITALLSGMGALSSLPAQAAQPSAQPASVAAATGAGEVGIAAIVNDDVISKGDVERRMRLALLGTGITPNPDVLAKLRGQIIRSLIDERLQLQEAAKYNIEVPTADIDAQVAQLAAQNKMPVTDLPKFFASKGVDISTLREQIRATLSWTQVVQRRLRPQVNIGDDEVDTEIERLMANVGQTEYLVAEIYLPVDNPSQEQAAQQTAQKLIEQMRAGARFSVIARQFSQSSTAAAGGDLGWVSKGQMEPQLNDVLEKMQAGMLSPPVRTATGYHILMLREVRQQNLALAAAAPQPAASAAPAQSQRIALRQLFLALPKTATTQQLAVATTQLEGYRSQAKSCAAVENIAKSLGDSRGGDLGLMAISDLPVALQPVIKTLAVGQPSPALRNEQGVLFLMVCSRVEPQQPVTQPAVSRPQVAPEQRTQIINSLGQQKLEMMVRRYLRDVRQNAFIDVRG